jgi:superoxide dismutase, Fe-Mn family
MPFELPELPYAYDALASFGMSEETLKLHHDLHHKAYVDNGNKAIAGTQYDSLSLDQAVVATFHAGVVNQSPLFNNLSQHWNHNLFWEIMGPEQAEMPDSLGKAISQSFGSIETFKSEFVTTGISQFGSGWVWLIKDDALGSLRVMKTENGVNPLCFGHKTLLGCDVWEHSYYLDFRNKRPGYIENFLDKLVNWNAVATRL